MGFIFVNTLTGKGVRQHCGEAQQPLKASGFLEKKVLAKEKKGKKTLRRTHAGICKTLNIEDLWLHSIEQFKACACFFLIIYLTFLLRLSKERKKMYARSLMCPYFLLLWTSQHPVSCFFFQTKKSLVFCIILRHCSSCHSCHLVPLSNMCLLCLNRGLGGIIQLSPVAGTTCWAPIGHLSQQSRSAEATVWVFFLEVGVDFAATREALHKILEEVATEDHVYPRVTAAVETGKECRQRHCCVLWIWRTERGRRERMINSQNIWYRL